jgi:hypothetical protein
MAFLYGESSPGRGRELRAHLEQCGECASQVQTWRATMSELEAWKLPQKKRAAVHVLPALRWAAAAAVVLAVGFFLGRQNSGSAREIAELKASVTELRDLVRSDSTITNSVAAAASVAGTETLRLLANYARVQEEQRVADRQDINMAVKALNARLNRINNDLETVALGTEDAFQETHENITRVASISLANKPQSQTE